MTDSVQTLLLRILANAGTSPNGSAAYLPSIAVAYRTHGQSGGWLAGKGGGHRHLAYPEAA